MTTLEAVLLGWSGVVADDERIQGELINQLLVEDNLRPLDLKDWQAYRLFYAGQPDRVRLGLLWQEQGRLLDQQGWERVLERKADLYAERIVQQNKLPLMSGIRDLLTQLETLGLRWILVSGTSAREVEALLTLTGLSNRFNLRATGDDLATQSPLTDGILHQLALSKLSLSPLNALGIESTYAGIFSALSADLEVLGIPSMMPMHMLQRRVDWVFDRPDQIDWERLLRWRNQGDDRPLVVSTEGDPLV